MTQEEMDVRTKAKEVWKDMVLNYSDTVGTIGVDPVKKKLKLLNKIIDEMPIEEVVAEMQENEAFIKSFGGGANIQYKGC